VPQALLQRIPPGGYTREQLEPVLKKSHYAAALKYGAMLCNSTGNYFLDADEECADNSCDNWDKGLVEDAALEWKAAEAVLASTHKLAQWLNADPARHFETLLNYLERRLDGQGRKRV